MSDANPMTKFRRIAVEEAFSIPEVLDLARDMARDEADISLDRLFLRNLFGFGAAKTAGGINYALARLQDMADGRLAEMDQYGIDVHVMSLATPGVQIGNAGTATDLARLANDRLAASIERNPSRFAGLACFAPQNPARAASEMERAINSLKLNGFIVNSHTEGEYLDEAKFWPILEAAEALGRCIYIHPRCPPNGAGASFRGYEDVLGSAGYGFAAETSVHAVRLLVSGVFDRFPNLKICLGHMGEGLPFWFSRLDKIMGMYQSWGDYKNKLLPSEYFKRNFVISTSGVEDHQTLQFAIGKVGIDNVMWAIDYPFVTTEPCVVFMDTAPLSDADKAKVYGGNAERIFYIAPQETKAARG